MWCATFSGFRRSWCAGAIEKACWHCVPNYSKQSSKHKLKARVGLLEKIPQQETMAPRRGQQESYGSISMDNYDEESVPLIKNLHKKGCNKRLWLMAASAVFVAAAITMHVMGRASEAPDRQARFAPLSQSPVEMNLLYTNRKRDASPSGIWGNVSGPLPTNSWYLVSEYKQWLCAYH